MTPFFRAMLEGTHQSYRQSIISRGSMSRWLSRFQNLSISFPVWQVGKNAFKHLAFFSIFISRNIIITYLTSGYLTVDVYEDGFLTLKEQEITGSLAVVSSAMWGMRDTRAFSEIFLDHPLFGQNTRYVCCTLRGWVKIV